MLKNIYQFCSSGQLKIPAVALVITLGVVGEQTRPVLSNQIEINSKSSAKDLKTSPATTGIGSRTQKSAKEAANVPISNVPKQDGVYLYGQSPEANQMGQGYIIFEKRQDKVSGALYMPNSEFSCFQGTIDRSGELAMTVNGSADESSSNEVATSNRLPTINEEELSSYPYSVALQDYHQLKSISANDQRILQMCNQSSTTEYRKLVK